MSANIKNAKKTLIIGIVCVFVLTVLYHMSAIFTMILEMSNMYSFSTLSYILQIVRDIIELAIYASGIALVLTFVRLRNKKFRNFAYISVLLILFFDYGVSFTIDFAMGNIDGLELVTAIYIFLNIIARAAMYALTVFFAERIAKESGRENLLPIPFVSKSDPASKILSVVFFIRISPYVLFEIYSNVTGIIEYGFDMTGADVLSIISAYVEIILAGVLVYIISYLFLLLYLTIHEKAHKESE